MIKLTTPKAILIGFALIAFSIASIPYSNLIVPKAYAGDSDILFCIDGSRLTLDGTLDGSYIWLTGSLSTYCNG